MFFLGKNPIYHPHEITQQAYPSGRDQIYSVYWLYSVVYLYPGLFIWWSRCFPSTWRLDGSGWRWTSIGSGSWKVTVGFSPPPLSISSDIPLNGIVYPKQSEEHPCSWLLLEKQMADMARKCFAQIYIHYVLQLCPFLGWMVLSCPFTFNYLSIGQLQYSLQRAVLQVVQNAVVYAVHNSRC